MLHPSHELRFINPVIGYGVFATELISKGTIVGFVDSLDIKILPKTYERLNDKFREIVEHFCPINVEGDGVLTWDNFKYINHSCDSNLLITAHQLSIAVRDIVKDEEITLDYMLLDAYLNIQKEGEGISCQCGSPNCRKIINNLDIDSYLPIFISRLNEALSCSLEVKQPLFDFMDTKEKNELIKAFQNHSDCSKIVLEFLKKRSSNFHKKWNRILSEKI
jgi:uncharacterized protein